MATITLDRMTLLELAKRTTNNTLIQIAEVLSKKCPIFGDAPWIAANQATSNVIPRRIALPTGSKVAINQGAASEVSRVNQIVEPIAMFLTYSKVDKKLLDISPDKRATRFSEDLAFLEGLTQSAETELIYGTKVGADGLENGLDGLATRFNLLALANVIGGGGTGADETSLWIVRWSPVNGAFLHYPMNDKNLGINRTDLGMRLVLDDDSLEYTAFVTEWMLKLGLSIKDDRCVQRIANIDPSSTYALDDDDIITALNKMPSLDGAVIYANRQLKTQLDILAKDKTNVAYTIENVFGRPTTHFQGVPVRLAEKILSTETAIT